MALVLPAAFPPLEVEAPYLAEFDDFHAECEEAGIAMGFQRCPTLGHCAGPLSAQTEPSITREDWQVNAAGEAMEGLLCPTSPRVLKYVYERTRRLLARMRPSSFWVDDDLRMGVCKREGCFCPRCMKLFHEQYGVEWTREELAYHLNARTEEFEEVRAQWCQFHAHNNALVMEAYRRAVEEVLPECRLGWQTAMQTHTYNGLDYTPVYDAMSGPCHRSVNIRPGGGYYCEDVEIKCLLGKAFEALVACARAVQYPQMEQICYEAENYPHTGQLKSARQMMVECALMVGCGCNSLTFYWQDPENPEPQDNYEHFAATCAAWRPFLEALADRLPGTVNAGLTQLVGPSQAAMPNCGRESDDWRCYGMWHQLAKLWRMGIAVTAPDGATEVRIGVLTERQIGGYTDAELAEMLRGRVIVDTLVLERLNERMADWAVTPVRSMKADAGILEVMPDGMSCWDCTPMQAIEVQDETLPGVRVYSRIAPHVNSVQADAAPVGLGKPAVVRVPTRFGGQVLVVGGVGLWEYATGARLAMLRQAIDETATAPLPVKMLSAHPFSVVARVDDEGRAALAVLVNGFLEEAEGVRVAIRRPRGAVVRFLAPEREPIELMRFPKGAEEIIVSLPAISIRGVAAIACE